MNDAELHRLSENLGDHLKRRGWLLATAESCTGGWIAKVITDIAGSSEWFDRGFVSYSNEAKRDLLGVEARTLEVHGAVSEHTVCEMVRGALSHSRAELAVAVSGIAGPGGGSSEKPVGTVWLAWGRRGGGVRSEVRHFSGDREAVRRLAVARALEGLIELAEGDD